jgi:tRNA (guanine-N7-)-methyltransferase
MTELGSTVSETKKAPEQGISAPEHRRIKSFVMRPGRMTEGQKTAFERHWADKGLALSGGQLDFEQVFGRKAPLVLEIGFGMGQSLIEMCQAQPEKDFIGIEVHLPGVGKILREAEVQGVHNLRIYKEDAIEVLQHCIADASLDLVQLFFPDPWHKKKHHKRRIVQGDFADFIRSKLKMGGCFHMATDWEPYAEHMLEVMSGAPGYVNKAGPGQYHPKPETRPLTKFEVRGQKLGHGVWDLLFDRTE